MSKIEASNSEGGTNSSCELCAKSTEKQLYICPRCHIKYCSLLCYKSPEHLACTEAFYRDNCLEELKSRETEEPKTSLLDRLKELNQDEEEVILEDLAEELVEDAQAPDEELDHQLKALGCGQDIQSMLSALSPDEREAFQGLVQHLGIDTE